MPFPCFPQIWIANHDFMFSLYFISRKIWFKKWELKSDPKVRRIWNGKFNWSEAKVDVESHSNKLTLYDET